MGRKHRQSEAGLDAIKQTLATGWPVCGGFRWPKQDQWKNEVLQMSPAEVFDGHSVLLVGYRMTPPNPAVACSFSQHKPRRS